MIRNFIKVFSFILIAGFSLQIYADQNIRVKVIIRSNINDIAGLGYSVAGKSIGGPGRSFSGKGPINKSYSFGYRIRFPHRKDISCGTQILTRDSTVILVTNGKTCRSIISR